MTDHPITGMLALGPVRGAIGSLRQVLALHEFDSDTIVIVGDASASPQKREAYRNLFAALGRARRSVVWVPGPVDRVLESELRRAYEMAEAEARPISRRTEVVLFSPGMPPSDLGTITDEILDELLHTFRPGLAARVERPALYALRDRGGSEWDEV